MLLLHASIMKRRRTTTKNGGYMFHIYLPSSLSLSACLRSFEFLLLLFFFIFFSSLSSVITSSESQNSKIRFPIISSQLTFHFMSASTPRFSNFFLHLDRLE